MSFEHIPTELTAYKQWVVWRYATRPDGKKTKLPFNARTGYMASITDPLAWSTFEEAVSVALNSPQAVSGIGFVLSDEDPYCFIDLDDAFATQPDGSLKYPNAQEWFERQQAVYQAVPSYAELSPSGKGLHIISRATVLQGRRKGPIEVYSTERYMTMTGNVYRAAAIQYLQPQIDWLFDNLGSGRKVTPEIVAQFDRPEREPDEGVLKRVFGAANGEKAQALWEGRFIDAGYDSQSQADYAFIDILQFHTQNHLQIRRLFFMSALGRRDKAKRPGYVEHMIQRSFDRLPTEIDIEALAASLEAERERHANTRAAAMERVTGKSMLFSGADIPLNEIPPDQGRGTDFQGVNPYIDPVPGLLGSVASFIYRVSPRPVPEIAMAGAIGLLAGICGRAFNVNGTGLNMYILLLARTGRGKEAIATGIAKLMAQVKDAEGGGGGVPAADEFLGPQEIASGQALIKYLSKTSRSFISVISEFDTFLAGLTARNVNPAVQKLKQVLLYAYSRSGQNQRLDKSIYSEADKNVPVIFSPAVSMVGEGTPDKFYELLSDDLVSDGFLTRFSVIEYTGPRVPLSKGFQDVRPEPELVQSMMRLCVQALSLNAKNHVVQVTLDPDAQALLDAFDKECDGRVNGNLGVAVAELWNRAHLKALKLASLIAVGVNWYNPRVTAANAQWAINATRFDTGKLTARFEAGSVGMVSIETQQMDAIRRKLQVLFGRTSSASTYKLSSEAVDAGIFNSYYLQSAISNVKAFKDDRRGANNAYLAAMSQLAKMGVIDEVGRADKERLSLKGTAWVVKEWGWLNDPKLPGGV